MKTNYKIILLTLATAMLLHSCKEKEPDDPCILEVSIQINSLKATAIAESGLEPYSYLWSTGATTKEINGPFSGTYSVTVTDDIGCTAGASTQFTNPCGSLTSVTDADGFNYGVTAIGNQCWTTSNVNVIASIPKVEDNVQWSNLTTPGWCYYNNGVNGEERADGRMYNWYAVKATNLCPQGWHVPADSDWVELKNFLGLNGGGHLKDTSSFYWYGPNSGADDSTGFHARGSGYRLADGRFAGWRSLVYFWSTTESGTYNAWTAGLSTYDNLFSHSGIANKKEGHYCRCIRDRNPNPCVNITCQNGGTCLNGTCNCPPGFTGTFCETPVNTSPPIKVHIHSVKVKYFYPTQFNGNPYDTDNTGPDLRLSISKGMYQSTDEFYTIQIFSDQSAAPVLFANDFPYTITDMDTTWNVALWDDDAPASPLTMHGISFGPQSSWSFVQGADSFNLQSTTNYPEFTVYVTWVY